MPRLPGRESTKVSYKVDQLDMGGFIMEHETWYWRRKCCVEGCEHRMGPKTDEPGWVGQEPCSRSALPGWAFLRLREGMPLAGPVCACHAAEILDRT